MSPPQRIMLSAGEASGDRLGAGLARALLRRRPELELIGMGGEQMSAAGVRLIQDASEVAVVGIFEVLAHLPAIRRAKKLLEQALIEERPNLLVPIDFPDFNLRLAAEAGRTGVPVVYFVSPQIWAWRQGRIKRIRELVRRMLVLFPFETKFYEEAGVPVTFVGHPVAERDEQAPPREMLCERAGLDPGRAIVALLPGSRRAEVARLLPLMLQAARLLGAKRPDTQWLIPHAPGLPREALEQEVAASGIEDVFFNDTATTEIYTVCAAGAVAAGTASLEAAAVGLPMVVVHRIHPLSYLLARTMVQLEDVALPNLIAGRRVVPELIQKDCTPERIAVALGCFLDEPEIVREVREGLLEVRSRLGGPGVFERAAEQLLKELDRAR
jgi:lipid-A-disaccharide synthase